MPLHIRRPSDSTLLSSNMSRTNPKAWSRLSMRRQKRTFMDSYHRSIRNCLYLAKSSPGLLSTGNSMMRFSLRRVRVPVFSEKSTPIRVFPDHRRARKDPISEKDCAVRAIYPNMEVMMSFTFWYSISPHCAYTLPKTIRAARSASAPESSRMPKAMVLADAGRVEELLDGGRLPQYVGQPDALQHGLPVLSGGVPVHYVALCVLGGILQPDPHREPAQQLGRELLGARVGEGVYGADHEPPVLRPYRLSRRTP